MRKTKVIQIESREIKVSELTVEQVGELIRAIETPRDPYTAEMLFDSPVPMEAVTMSTGLQASDLERDYSPTELWQIWEAVAEVNDFLSRMTQRLVSAAMAENKMSSSALSAG